MVVGIEIERGLLAGVAGPAGVVDDSGALLVDGSTVADGGVGVWIGFAPEEAGCEGGRLDSLSEGSGFSVLMGGVVLLLREVWILFWGVSASRFISQREDTGRIVLRSPGPKDSSILL